MPGCPARHPEPMTRFPPTPALLLSAALLVVWPALAGLAVIPPRTLCRVEVVTTPALIAGTYNIKITTRPECPPNGYAFVRAESGRIYPWRMVTPGQPATVRGVAWWWRITWQAASGKRYTVPTPGMKAPWGTP